MIKIIKETTFGYFNGKFVEPKTKGSEPFELDPKREAELVEAGIAEYVGKAAYDDEPPTDEPPTDEIPDGAEFVDGFVLTQEYLEGLKMDKLKEFAAQFGVEYKVGTKKADFINEIWEAIDDVANEELTDVPPVVNPADSIV